MIQVPIHLFHQIREATSKLRQGSTHPGFQGSLYDLHYQQQHHRTSLKGTRGCRGIVPTQGEDVMDLDSWTLRVCNLDKGHQGAHYAVPNPVANAE